MKVQRTAAIALWAAVACWSGWDFRHGAAYGLGGLFFAFYLWFPLYLLVRKLPAWMAWYVRRKNRGSLKFILPSPYALFVPDALRIGMEADLSLPARRKAILAGARQICGAGLVLGASLSLVLVTAWLVLRWEWLPWGVWASATVLGRGIYPRNHGVRSSELLRQPDSLVRALCRKALAHGLSEELPIEQWHPSWFEIIQPTTDRQLPGESNFAATSWNYTYTMLKGDMQAAGRYVEQTVALLPEDRLTSAYVVLGDALYFYTTVVPDQGKTEAILQRIRSIPWEMPNPGIDYIESAIALAAGRKQDATRIAQTRLTRIGPDRHSAWFQLERLLLNRCIEAARPRS